MKSTANSFKVVLLLAILFTPVFAVRADNVCECASPPGGRITCPDDCMAICRVVDGKVNGECKRPSKDSSEGDTLKAWALSLVLGKKVQVADLKREEYQAILEKGRYENKKTGEILLFRLPKSR